MAQRQSVKRALIDKANTTVVIAVGSAAFVVIFSLVATKALINQAGYQNRVIEKKEAAVKQLRANLDIVKEIEPSYRAFVGTTTNAIGGNSAGTGSQDGDNAKIILDALPSRYDYPGLTTNLDRLVSSQGAALVDIEGTDDEVAQSANTNSITPTAIPMPFELTAGGNYESIQKVLGAFERSIRPIKIQSLEVSGTMGELKMTIKGESYYQPAKSLNIRKEVVK